jgi:hypothetical protein
MELRVKKSMSVSDYKKFVEQDEKDNKGLNLE